MHENDESHGYVIGTSLLGHTTLSFTDLFESGDVWISELRKVRFGW
jgi:hypothetical protein